MFLGPTRDAVHDHFYAAQWSKQDGISTSRNLTVSTSWRKNLDLYDWIKITTEL